ncbi:MAG: MutS-related protein, partial [bacterium]
NLRHPIIERLITNVEYIGNDISLNQNGILLYGINASGKSSLMKALGLAIIMVQSGMYVPATSFEFSPYHHIFTRICGNDDIYRGMSSFVVEMSELRNILQRADERSLVIGDEICCGTEAISA